jgi:hypothetical protein
MIKTKKAYRDYLNQAYPATDFKNRGTDGIVRGQRKRAYGDYLWFQDREKFEADYQEWLKENI